MEKDTADLLHKYGVDKKTIVTSFSLDRLRNVRAYAPRLHIGYLTKRIDYDVIKTLLEAGVDEICPKASLITSEMVDMLHRRGFNVRAWGVANEEVMKAVYDAGVDGMTVNFPDRLTQYIAEEKN